MQPTVSELPGSRVSVEVEVPAADVDRAISRAARGLAREMRMPGFRKGKAPPSLVIQRVGFAAVLEEAIREALPEWYERALLGSGIAPVGDPSVEVVSTPEAEGEPLAFKFEIGVRPKAELGEYKGLEVGKAEPEPPAEIVDREVERIREGFAKLEPVDRAAAEGDVLLVDFEGLLDGKAFEGGKASDYLLELGGGQLIEGFEEQLAGAGGGETRKVEVTFPDDYQAEQLAGEDAVFTVEVKEVREKVLPELDDDFASEASEFDTLEELRGRHRQAPRRGGRPAGRAGLPRRRGRRRGRRGQARPARRARHRPRHRALGAGRTPARRGAACSPDAYLQMQGKTREEMIEESKPEAEAELKREAVLAAIADAEEIEVSEEEMVEALAHSAEHERTTPEKLLEAPARERPRRDDPRRHPLPQGDRPGRRGGQADPARAGRGARADLDAGEGAQRGGRALDPDSE